MVRSSVSSARSSIPSASRWALSSSGIFRGRAREEALVESGDEDVAERQAAGLFDGADPDLAVAGILGRGASEFRRGPSTSSTSASDTGPMSDMGSSSSSRWHDALGIAEGEFGEIHEGGDPFAPEGARGQGGESCR